MRLRLGADWLSVVTGRWVNGGTQRAQRYCKKCTACAVEDEKHFLMECPAYQAIQDEFKELYDDCGGDIRKLMCHPRQYILAKLVHKMRVFRDEDEEWLFDTHLDMLDSDEDIGSGLFEEGDNDEFELVEVDVELRQLGFVETP